MRITAIFLLSLSTVICWGQQIKPKPDTIETYYNQPVSSDPGDKHIYEVNAWVEIPLSLGLSAATGYGFMKIEDKHQSSEETILALNYVQDVPKINRWTSEPQYNPSAAKTSDYFFYGSFGLGIIPLFDKNINNDYGRILLMYWEAIALTGTIYSITAAHVDKYRPLAYSDEAPMKERQEDGSKNSFPGGHPSITAAASFFVAKVFSDYYPHRKGMKIALYSTAAALTLTNAYLRWDAGKHFPTDLIIGMGYGTLVGILIPELHKIKNNDSPLSLTPLPGGLSIRYALQ
jgi:membrane-associated phospholipid phosphatase